MENSKSGQLLSDEVAGVNRLLPHVNKWAWDLWEKGVANNWNPKEIGMMLDAQQWNQKDFLTDDERLVIKRCLGFFAGSESLVANNLLFTVFRHIPDAECRQYILRQSYEESLHNATIVYCCDSLNLDADELYGAYQSIPSIKAKDDFLMQITSDINRPGFTVKDLASKQELLRNLISYYVVCEGIMFFSGFAMLLSFGRQNKLPGITQQIQYTLRDESLHVKFGVELINRLIQQYPEVWTAEFEQETIDHIKTATELEVQYAKDVLPNGILGLNADMFVDYMHYIANRRLESLNINYEFPEANNPFNWMTEVVDLGRMKNFFEQRVTDYSSNTLEDDF